VLRVLSEVGQIEDTVLVRGQCRSGRDDDCRREEDSSCMETRIMLAANVSLQSVDRPCVHSEKYTYSVNTFFQVKEENPGTARMEASQWRLWRFSLSFQCRKHG
jgi:hypothetical protein